MKIVRSDEFGVLNLQSEIYPNILEISLTVILNLFQDLTPWTKRDAELSSA
jgi:hypothetical protein